MVDGPSDEQTERVSGRVDHDSHIFLGLECGWRGACFDRPGHPGGEIGYSDVKMDHHLLLSGFGRPNGWDVIRFRLEGQPGSGTRRPQNDPVGFIDGAFPAEQLLVEAGQPPGVR